MKRKLEALSLPTLYKKTSTGAIQFWSISVQSTTIHTKFGQVDGKEQETTDIIKAGKNQGKSNASTPEKQAKLEARAKWTKQKKKGYVETMAAAESNNVD